MASDGTVAVSDLLKHHSFRRADEAQIRRCVEDNNKKRFALSTGPGGELRIRASQGHSIDTVDADKLLTRITPESAAQYQVVVHGTQASVLPAIRDKGLSRMTRQHIHFAKGLFGDEGVVSGMRATCNAYIYIDLPAAVNDGFEFFESANGVILTPGNSDGFLPPQYFSRVDVK